MLAQWRTEVRVGGAPVQVQGVIDHPAYAQHWPLLEQRSEAWRQLASGAGAMLSEQLARRLALSLGDRLSLPGAAP